MFGIFKNSTENSQLKVKVSKKEWKKANQILKDMRDAAIRQDIANGGNGKDVSLKPFKISRKNYRGLKHSFEFFDNGKLYCLDREYLGFGSYGKVKLAETQYGELKVVKISSADKLRQKTRFEQNSTRVNYKSGASENPSHLRGAIGDPKKGLFKRQKKLESEVWTSQKNVELMDLKKGRDLLDEKKNLSESAKIITGIRMLLDVQRRFHDLGEIHRDLKPDNMMAYIDATKPNDVVITIIDPDMSTEVSSPGPAKPSILEQGKPCGAEAYIPNETFIQGYYGVATDVYALARVLFRKTDLALNPDSYPISFTGTDIDFPENRPQIWEMVQELWDNLDPNEKDAPYMITTKKMVDRLIREKNPTAPNYDPKLAERTEIRTNMIRFATNIATQKSSCASDTVLKELLAIAIKQLLMNESAELEDPNSKEPPDLNVLIEGYEIAIINTIQMIKYKNAAGLREPDHLFNSLINQLQAAESGTWQKQLLGKAEVQKAIDSIKGEPFNYTFTTDAQITLPKMPDNIRVLVKPAVTKATTVVVAPSKPPEVPQPPKAYIPPMTAQQRENEIKKALNNAAKVAKESCPLLAQIHQAYREAKYPTPKENSSSLILHAHDRMEQVKVDQDKEFFNQLEKIIMHPVSEKTKQAKQVQEVIDLCNSKKSVRATEHFIAAYTHQSKPLTTDSREAWVAKGLNDLNSDATKAFTEPQQEQRMSSSSLH